MMEAHLVKYGTKVKVTDQAIKVPPGAIPVNTGDEIILYHSDGMYRNARNAKGDRIYISVWTEVEPIEN